MIRLARWDVAASTYASSTAGARGDRTIDRLSAPVRGPGFWLALWAVAIGAEFGALVPVIWPGEEPVAAVQVDLPPHRRVVRGLRSDRLAPAARQPQRPAHDRRPASASSYRPRSASSTPPRADRVDPRAGDLGAVLRALLLTFLTGGRLASRVDWLLVGAFVLALWVLQVVWLLFYRAGRQPARRVPGRRHRRRRRQGPAHAGRPRCVGVASCSPCAGGGVAPRAGARCCRASPARRPAAVRRAADQRPRDGPAVAVLLWLAFCSLLRSGRVPRRAAALAARPRRPRRPLPRAAAGCAATACRRRSAKTLGDPKLVVAYRLPGSTGHADAGGRPCWCRPVSRTARAPVERDGREVAALVYDASLDDDPELVEAVRAAAAMALENEHLQAESRGAARRAAGVARAHRRGRRRRAPAARAQPARRRAAAARRARAAAAADPDGHPATTRPGARSSSPTASDELAQSLAGAARARARHPPRRPRPRPRRALESLAARSPVPTTVTCEAPGRCPRRSSSPPTSSPARRWPTSAKYAQATAASRARVAHAGRHRSIEIADDGVGGADARARLRAARPGRPRRGARRAPARHQPAGRRHRRHRGAAVRVVIADDSVARARGHRVAPDPRRDRGRGAGGSRRRAAARGRRAPARRRDRRHPDAADAHRRGAARGPRDPRRGTRRSAS